MQYNMLDVSQEKDLLGMVVGGQDEEHSSAEYLERFKLAVVDTNTAEPLGDGGDSFMLQIGELSVRGELAALVSGLLGVEHSTSAAVHMYGITALHVACTTGHYLQQARAVKATAEAGGVQAVMNAMNMNRSSAVPLHIVCVRMLTLYAPHSKETQPMWGQWTLEQATKAMECVIKAMREFTSSLDLQCCAVSCLVAMCAQAENSWMMMCKMFINNRKS